VQLPDERARAMGFASPIMLNAELESLGLGNHAVVDILLQRGGQSRDREHEIVAFVLWIVLIVMVHRRAMMVELIVRDVAAQGLIDRGGMHAKFTDEAAHIFSIVQEGNPLGTAVHAGLLAEVSGKIAMPDLPVMQV